MSSLVAAATGWRARLELEVLDVNGRAVLGERRHEGPLRIQRPFYPEGDAPLHLYVLHPPGGLVAGDELDVRVHLRPRARALLTTPSAQKLYRSNGAQSSQRVSLSVEAEACLEWLPAETIVFDAARSVQRTRIELAEGAACIAWDIGCLGRAASGERFQRGIFRQELELWRGGEPLLIERNQLSGDSPALSGAFGYAGCSVYGNLYATPGSPALVSRLRESLTERAGVQFAVTLLGNLLVVRALGARVELVRRALIDAWQLLRPDVVGRAPQLPRIWAT